MDRLEREARQSPGRYRFKLALLAGLGFAVLGGTVVLALGMSVGLVLVLAAISPILLLKLIKIIWIPIAFGWFVIKSLWIRMEPPSGYVLRDGEAPELRAEVEWLREQTGAPPLQGIIIDSQLNAAAASVPRAMGLIGHAHYLVLGLPLMQLLNREQFDSVIAHEFGHFGGGHSRFAGWIYRVRASWYTLLDGLALQRSWTTRLFRRFFDWYAPYFNAYSFVLARANEYEADATAARVVGAPAAAQALQRVGLGATVLDRDFWPGVQRSMQTHAQPPLALYREMAASFSRPGADESTRLAELLQETPDLEDTHPTLAQRLEALGQAAAPVPAPNRSAADVLLGPLQELLQERFSQEWREQVEEQWRERHGQHRRDSARLDELENRAERTGDEAVEHARLVDDLRPDVDAVPLFRAAIEISPNDPLAHYRLGVLLLQRDDNAGVVHLRRAMDLDPDATEPALHQLDRYHQRRGNITEREAVQARLRALNDRRIDALHARNELGARDRFVAHGLEPAVLREAVEAFDGVGNVKQAWIARKQIDGDSSGVHHYAVLVAWRGMVLNESSTLQKVVDALELPGSFIVFTAANQRSVASRVKKAAGAPVYGRR
ncbi:M48 family metalloprotease [Lysobacter sp. S4-A87]|uniref:M48 family metalloprotease n=1 Tax=Lysobacter sp. S4-A87 TaxID=2925843 RepID=UPI001F53C94A|nr:M48 family metalloprotease [Lysobacter sp. S4-A87]UNK51144.1 M48 family metalloprotease [Lysobacter sp. S4-A87]